MRQNNSASGFTLLELVIASAMMLFIVAVAVAFSNGALLRVGSLVEARERTDRAEMFDERLRGDIEPTGLNLVRLSNDSAGTEDVTYSTSPNHVQVGTTLRTLTAMGYATPPVYSSRVIKQGVGGISFKVVNPMQTLFTVLLDDGKAWRGIANEGGHTYTHEGAYDGSLWAIADYYQYDLSAATYEVNIENAADGGHVVRYYRTNVGGTRRLLHTSVRGMLSYPITIRVHIFSQGEITDSQITGAVLGDAASKPLVLAQLPYSADGPFTDTESGRPALPVILHKRPLDGRNDGFTLLRGDQTTDVVRLESPYNSRGVPCEIDWRRGGCANPIFRRDRNLVINAPVRGQFEAGDKMLLIDYASGRSLLLQCDGVGGRSDDDILVRDEGAFGVIRPSDSEEIESPASPLQLMATPITTSNSSDGWGGLFWSHETDAHLTFPAGSVLVKLAEPIEYRWDGAQTVFRRVGTQAWAIAATGVTDFFVEEAKTADSYGLRVKARMMPDNAMTSGQSAPPLSEYEAVFSPRALNLSHQH